MIRQNEKSSLVLQWWFIRWISSHLPSESRFIQNAVARWITLFQNREFYNSNQIDVEFFIWSVYWEITNWDLRNHWDSMNNIHIGRSHFLHLEKSYHFLHLDFWPFSPPRPYYLKKYQNLHYDAFLRKYRFLHLFLRKIPNSPHVSVLDDK